MATLIDTETAQQMMAEGLIAALRITDDGKIDPATEWAPDENWPTTRDDNGQRFYILDTVVRTDEFPARYPYDPHYHAYVC